MDQCLVESAKGAGAVVELDASATHDANGQTPTYGWTLPAGAALSTGASCGYAAGQILDVRLPVGAHLVGPEARDAAGNVSTDTIVVHVAAP